MRIGSLFSGIDGLGLGLERAGVGHVVWQVEQDEFCRRVLAKHWPHAERYDDVRTVGAALAPVDLVCGGFPCQPVSVAGRRKAQEDARWLWPEFARIVAGLRPAVVVAENVLGLRTAGLRDVLADLAALGFDAEWSTLAAGELGAPHLRRRIFIVATHPERIQLRNEPGWLGRAFGAACAAVPRHTSAIRTYSNSDGLRRLEQARRISTERGWAGHCGWGLDPFATLDDGLSERLVRGNLERKRKALGNSVVVPCLEVVGRALMAAIATEAA